MVAHVDVSPGSPSWLRLARRAKLLATLTLIWLGIEGTVGVVAGILAGSIALVAFGLDSAIEGLASVIVIWRFTGARTISENAERRAQKWVAVSFFLLAPYVAAEAIETLIEGAAAVLVGLTANTWVGLWWLDPAIALVISAMCVAKGKRRGVGSNAGAPPALRRGLNEGNLLVGPGVPAKNGLPPVRAHSHSTVKSTAVDPKASLVLSHGFGRCCPVPVIPAVVAESV